MLYTALKTPAAGFTSIEGAPSVKEHQPQIEVSALPRAEGVFQGRIDELKQLGDYLTSDHRPRIVTIHGSGGQGKTALAREAVERFAYAWPGGVWATTLENLPGREVFVNDLARFLGINTQTIADPDEVERLVTSELVHRRTLIVLDNAEELVAAVKAGNEEAVQLAQFIREQLPRPPVCLLATSRSFLRWADEIGYELTGLAPVEGVRLFQQQAPQRIREIDQVVAWELSNKVEGHPLSLQLLGSAFNASTLLLPAFAKEYEEELLNAENIYKDLDHRQRTLYASIETSMRYLNADSRSLLSGLWIFHAPFTSGAVRDILGVETKEEADAPSHVPNHLNTLWQQSLLTRNMVTVRDGTLELYYLLPVIRPYVEHHMLQYYDHETLTTRFGISYARLVKFVYNQLNKSAYIIVFAQQARADFERGNAYVTGIEQGHYLRYWGWIVYRLGNPWHGLQLLEQALEIAQGNNQPLELEILYSISQILGNTGRPKEALLLYQAVLPLMREMDDQEGEVSTLIGMADAYQVTSQFKEALRLYQEALLLIREMGDREGEAGALNNMAVLYKSIGQPQEALRLYQEALLLMREVGDRAGEALALSNMAGVYQVTGQPQEALHLYQEALPRIREAGNRAGEAESLISIGTVYLGIGQPQEALHLFQEALLLMREVGDRAGEAKALSSIGTVYLHIGQPQETLDLFQEALSLQREVGDRDEEAKLLNGIAVVYRDTSQFKEALDLFQEALSLQREVGNRAGEAVTLINMATMYQATGQFKEALDLFQEALPLTREVDDRAIESTTLCNMANVYQVTGQFQEALRLYQEALSLTREVGNRTGEAAILTNIAVVYRETGHFKEALPLFQEALLLARKVDNSAIEASALNGLAHVLEDMQSYEDALMAFERSVSLQRLVDNPYALQLHLLPQREGTSEDLKKPHEHLLVHVTLLRRTNEPQESQREGEDHEASPAYHPTWS